MLTPAKTLLALVCLLAGPALPAGGAEFDLGPRGVLTVAVPDGWTLRGEPAGKAGAEPVGFALAFRPAAGETAKGLVSFAFVPSGAPDLARLRAETRRVCEPIAAQSVEKKTSLRDFSIEDGFGAYAVFTDAALVGKPVPPGEYRVLATGQVQPGANLLGVVSLFADDADGAELKAMIEIINSLRLRPKGSKGA